MKLNNKGFAITALLYGLLILFVMFVSSYLMMLSSRKNRLDAIISDISGNYNQTGTEKILNLFYPSDTVTDGSELKIDPNNDMIEDHYGNIRYYGKDPNNYIDIGDNVLWRIIGVFDGKLKVMRSSSIGEYSWDSSESTINSGYGINEWTQADIMTELNTLYYNSTSGTCYIGSNNSSVDCDFTGNNGLSDSAKNVIEETTWYLGGWNTSSVTVKNMYAYERDTNVIINPGDGIGRNIEWTGKIALPYPSDYGYATELGSTKCSQRLSSYNNAGTDNTYPCRGNNWLWYIMTEATSASSDGQKDGSFLTPYLSYGYREFAVHKDGHVWYVENSAYPKNIVPTAYLKSGVRIIAGNGGKDNPYKLN